MKIQLRDFKNLPKLQREKILCRIKQIIVDVFVTPADNDYVAARFMALTGQYRAFFWPALQAIEKYLKANFLIEGKSVKGSDFGHKIVEMAKRFDSQYSIFADVQFAPAGEHVDLEKNDLWGSQEPFDFIRSVEKFGTASNRYNFFGADFEASYQPKLDQLIYILRSRCVGSELLAGVGKVSAYDYAAYEQNFSFAPPEYKQGSMYGKFSLGFTVPTIELALKGLYGNPELFEKWLTDNILIKKDEIDAIRNR